MAVIIQFAGFFRIAVRQQDRRRLVRLDPHVEFGHHVRAVRVVCDLAKPFRLTLGAVHAVRQVQPLKRGVGGGINLCLTRPDEPVLRDRIGGQGQSLSLRHDLLHDIRAINGGGDQVHCMAI